MVALTRSWVRVPLPPAALADVVPPPPTVSAFWLCVAETSAVMVGK